MKWTRFLGLLVPLTLLTLFVGSTPLAADQERGRFKARLSGFQEVPPISTPGHGEFDAKVDDGEVEFKLTFSGLEGSASSAHLHFAQRGVEAPDILVDLCTNTSPTGCPVSGTADTITGTITDASVNAIAAQGIVGDVEELLEAMRAGTIYVHVHSGAFTDGEIRGQVGRGEGRGRGRGRD